MAGLLAASERWLARAEEYRMVAEICRHDAARDSYLALADSCQEIADHMGRLEELVKALPKPQR